VELFVGGIFNGISYQVILLYNENLGNFLNTELLSILNDLRIQDNYWGSCKDGKEKKLPERILMDYRSKLSV
jgi:hypothetical protein